MRGHLLDYPDFIGDENQAEYLDRVTGKLIARYKIAVNDENECLSICNEALRRCMAKYDSSKGSNFANYYAFTASRLLLNAVKSRNANYRIPFTESMACLSVENEVAGIADPAREKVVEPVDLSFLKPSERLLLEKYFFDRKSCLELATIHNVTRRTIQNRLNQIIKKIREHYRVEVKEKPKLRSGKPVSVKQRSFTNEEITGFYFLTERERTIMRLFYVDRMPLEHIRKETRSDAYGIKKRALVKIRINESYNSQFFDELKANKKH